MCPRERVPIHLLGVAAAAVACGCLSHAPRWSPPAPVGGPDSQSVAAGPPAAIDLHCPEYSREVPVTVSWTAPRATPRGAVELWATADAGTTWRLAGVDSARRGAISFAAEDGVYGLLAVERAGENAGAPPRGREPPTWITIDTRPPRARITSARIVGAAGERRRGPRLRLLIDAADEGPAGVAEIDLYGATADGRDLRLLGRFAPSEVIDVDAGTARGLLGVHALARDRAGNEEPWPAEAEQPEVVVSIDAPRFEVRLVSLRDGGVLRGGSGHYLFFEVDPETARADVAALSVLYRLGDDGPWEPIAREVPFTDRFLWNVPRATADRCWFRVEFRDRDGLQGSTTPPWTVAIDSTPPRARIAAADDVGNGRVRVRFDSETDDPAGIARVWLYRTAADGWAPLGSVEPKGDSRIFELPEGTWGLKAVAEDRAGNRERAPAPGDLPDVHVTVEASAVRPALALKNFHGGQFQGGRRRFVFWEYHDLAETLAPAPFSIDFTRDGGATWFPVASGLAADARRFAWELPRLDGELARLRIRADLRDGGSLDALSAVPFLVESRPPTVILEGPRSSTTTRTEIRFTAWTARPRLDRVPTASDESAQRVALEKVECYAATEPGGEWRLAGTWNADSLAAEASAAVTVSLENGRHRLALVAWDRVGNRSPASSAGESSGTILVDTVRPFLRVSLDDERDHYSAGEEVAVEVRADDSNLASAPVSIELLETATGYEHVLEPFFPSQGRYVMRVPASPGDFTLRLVVADLAGNGTEFRHAFRVVPQRPHVRFIGLDRPASFRGGSAVEVRWETRLVRPGARAVGIDFSRDRGVSWTRLVDDFPNEGRWTWETPPEDIREALLRITVRRETGQEATAMSAPIAISVTAPRVVVESVEPVPAKRPEREGNHERASVR